MFNFELFLEIAQRFDAVGRALDLEGVEGITFGDTEFAAHDFVLRERIAVNVDAFDIDARCFGNAEGDRHRQVILVARKIGADIGKGIAERACGFGQPVNLIFDHLGVVPIARLHRQTLGQGIAIEIAQLAVNLDVAELVPVTFFDDVGDDEIALVGREFGHGGDDAEIGVAFGQVELAHLLLIERQAIRIVAGAGGEQAEEARLLGHHFAAQLAIAELFVADDVDLADFGLWPFADFEHDIDAVLFEHHHFRFDRSGKAALALVQLDDAGNVGADFGTGEDLARGQFDFGQDLVFLEALVAFKDDAVDHRVFFDLNNHIAAIVAQRYIGEQFGGVEVFQGLIAQRLRIGLARAQADIGQDRIGFETLRAFDGDRADRIADRRRGGGWRRGRSRCRTGRPDRLRKGGLRCRDQRACGQQGCAERRRFCVPKCGLTCVTCNHHQASSRMLWRPDALTEALSQQAMLPCAPCHRANQANIAVHFC